MKLYRFRQLSLPVVVAGYSFVWRKVFGVKIGPWFIGAIKGEPSPEADK